MIAYSGGRQSEQQQQQTIAAEKSAPGQHQRPQQADTDHAGVPAFAERLISNPEPADGTEREKRDLAAQENTAAWAFWIVLLTSGQFILSGIGLAALLETIKQGRLGLNRASEANEISNRVAEADLRPYLFIDRLEFVTLHDDSETITDEDGETTVEHGMLFGRVIVYFHNYGKVPARNISVSYKRYTADFWRGRFYSFRFGKIDLWLCAPSHERRAFIPFEIRAEDRSAFNSGHSDLIVRIRYSFEDDKETAFSEDAAFRISGDDLETFFLLTPPYRIKQMREWHKQRELDLAQRQTANHTKPRKRRKARKRGAHPE